MPKMQPKQKEKRTAFGLSEDDIKLRLFKRFEDFEYYSLKHLADLEKLPQERVRLVLRSIADRELAGDHKGKWHLKQAFKVKN